MRRGIYSFMIILFIAACSNTESEEVTTLQKDLRSKEETIEGLESFIKEQKDTIEDQKMEIEKLGKLIYEPEADKEVEEVPILDLGETFIGEDIEVTVSQVIHTSDGMKVEFEVYNKSDVPLEGNGGLKFILANDQYEEELNTLRYTMNFENTGWVYEDERRSGNYHYTYDKEININEVEYYIQKSGMNTELIGKWIVE